VPAILETVPVDQFVITYDGPALILITILLLLLLYRGNKLSRKEGLILIGSYVLYISLRTFMHL